MKKSKKAKKSEKKSDKKPVLEKSPYKNYSIREVRSAEASSYVIHVGSDVFSDSGKMVFTKQGASAHYHKIYEELLNVLDAGDEEEVAGALRCFRSFYILPLRLM